MSRAPAVRRTDKVMPDEEIQEFLASGYAGRVASVDREGWPYVCPLLFVLMNGEIWVHNASARGHLRSNVEHSPKVCFELDEAGDVFPYGRFECDTSIAYRSIVAFGAIRIVDDRAAKSAFFDALMKKYANDAKGRAKGFYPRLDEVTVYAITVNRVTGKMTRLPGLDSQWPRVDNSKSPGAVPPDQD
jgi:nitroimidazol reductase NimA-like FMN-containing flavoprotein (pyridoxamine 5'-phosphate oxidase superfamily)